MSASFHWIAWKSPIRLPNCSPLERVRARDVEGGLRDPERLRGDPDAAAVERRHRDAEAAALLVEQPVAADARALDREIDGRRRVEAELLLLARDPHVLGVEDEARDAARAGRRRVGAREEEERPGARPVGDPLLRPGDRPAVAVGGRAVVRSEPASEPEPGSVSANAPSCSPRASGGTKRARLLVGAEREDRQRRRARVHRDRHPDAGVGARELLEHEDVREEVGARAAVLLGDADAHQPELGELRDRARPGSGARDPSRPRSGRSPPRRTRARAPGSPAGRR